MTLPFTIFFQRLHLSPQLRILFVLVGHPFLHVIKGSLEVFDLLMACSELTPQLLIGIPSPPLLGVGLHYFLDVVVLSEECLLVR